MMDFATRPASSGWEILSLVPGTMIVAWQWWKPAHSPLDVVIRIPVEAIQAIGGSVSLRQIAKVAAIELLQVDGIAIPGGWIDAQDGMNPLLDQPLLTAPPWLDISFRLRLSPPMTTNYASRPTEANAMALEADWSAILGLEGQLSGLRKQLATLQGKMQALNRDLSSDENVAADNQDKREWQDARRWLRDASSLASRYIKEADAGVSSMAGSKRRMEQMVQDSRAGRLSPQQLEAARNEIEAYRKTVLNIQTQMQSALQSASRDGEQRAQQVMARIAAKVRNHRSKR